ncbi:deoxypodophyllotoxin synthase [Lactuca sativa]|uniref:Fe2OG dioxygenase domain-containing protein n=1 Tax=Lactuca sativa TaxID=4236 RepID=A0A9R1XAA0_LACSA|nr:deoxypodophyllotoxin synthase [Lactuca sativa]KAJ0204864.1 hypothetical protein LSAT_V11C500276270 [Lactuca sativa]
MAPNPNKLPVITFNTKTLNRSNGAWQSTSHTVRGALENYGCFILATDKVSSDLRDTMFELANDLFHLPMETKVKNTSDLLGFGYGKYASMPLWEYFGIKGGATIEGTQSFTDLLFPSGHKVFCETAFEYMKLLSEIDHCVMRMVFDSYGVDAKECDRLIDSTLYLSRFMKYRSPREGEGIMGLFPHSDKSFLAVLDDDLKGLEIQMKNGEWIYPEPSPSTFIVLAGEPFMAWSNGRIHAPVHQVAMRTSEKEVVRNSLGLFSFMRATVEVPQKLVDDEEHYLQFMPFNQIEFLKYVTTEEGKASKCAIKSYCGVTTGAGAD